MLFRRVARIMPAERFLKVGIPIAAKSTKSSTYAARPFGLKIAFFRRDGARPDHLARLPLTELEAL